MADDERPFWRQLQRAFIAPGEPLTPELFFSAMHSVTADPSVVALCRVLGGHQGEGRVVGHRVAGRCQRCGVGLVNDGS